MNWHQWPPAVRITLLYVLFGFLWIVWSDWLLTLWISDFEMLRKASTHKGWFYVGVTGIMLFFLIRNSVRKAEQTKTAFLQALHESERRLSTLMANLPGMAFRCCNDRNWTMLFVSKGCEELTGYPVSSLENSNLITYARIIHPDDRRRVYTEVAAKVQSKQHYQLNYRIVTKSGQVKWVWEQAAGVFNEEGTLLFIEGFITDVSAQKRAEVIINEQLSELERANAELDRFAQGVSHDLRSPLVTIEGFLALVRQDALSGNYQGIEKNLKRIFNITKKMHQLLEDLLRLARLGKIVSPQERFSMNAVVEEVVEHLHGIIAQNDCHISIEPDMPFVFADRSRILIVWQNLIENAIKFRDINKPLKILIGSRNSSEQPVFFIRDNGIGIDAAHHKEVFELFSRLNRESKGTGVGLSLVERIVRFHGGKVWIESDGQGLGSCFFFTLPAAPVAK